MKILCVIDSLGSGGAQRQLVNLALAFKEKSHEVSFLVYHSEPFYYPLLKKEGIEVIEVVEPNYLKRLFKMRKVIRGGGYDSVLSFLEAANFICEISALPFKKWQLVVGERSANPAILKSFKLRFYRFFHIFADVVVANSYENIKLVKKVNPLLSDKKLQVIYNLIDFDKWQPKPENYIFRKNGKFNLIVVASHQYLKNLMGLVEAVSLLNDDEKNQLIINWYGGDRPDNSKKESLKKIKDYGLENIFYFHEPTIDIANKVNEADALGLFSFYEGLPNVVCEAMTNAKPVISSCVSDIPLLLDNDYLFDPNDITGILRVIRRLLSSSEAMLEKIGERNSQIANTKFKKENIVDDYLKALKASTT